MPEINIKQTVNDSQLKKGFAESAGSIRSWGKEASRVFEETRTAAEKYEAQMQRLGKMRGYLGEDAYGRAARQAELKFLPRAQEIKSTPPAIPAGYFDSVKAAGQIFAQTRTPMERYAIDLAKIEKLHKDGFLATNAYARATDQLTSKLILGGNRATFKGLPQAAGVMGGASFADTAAQISGSFGPLGGMIAGVLTNPLTGAAAAAAATLYAVKNLAVAMDETAHNAENLGVSLGTFLKLETAAINADTPFELVNTAMLKLTKTIGTAAVEGGSAEETFKRLGLTSAELESLSPDAAFVRTAKAVSEMSNRYDRARVEVELFGKSGAKMDTMLREVTKGIEDLDAPLEENAQAVADLGHSFEVAAHKAKNFFINLAGEAILQKSPIWKYILGGPIIPLLLGGEKPDTEPAVPPDIAADRQIYERRKARTDVLMGEAKSLLPKDEESRWEKFAKIKNELDGLGQRGKEAREQVDKIESGMLAAEEAAKKTKIEQEAAKVREADQKKADAAQQQWVDRLEKARGNADELAASLIRGSKEFAGNMEKARDLIANVKKAESENELIKSAEQFEKQMRREFRAKDGETSREAQLRELVNGGLNERSANRFAEQIAQLDAEASVTRRPATTAAMSFGSREANDILAARSQGGKEDKAAQLQADANRHLARMQERLRDIYYKTAQVAPAP